MTVSITSYSELESAAHTFLSTLPQTPKGSAHLYILTGSLGAGKTTFIKSVASQLGITDTVVSPTFNLMKVYQTPRSDITHLVHIDAYRLESKEELKALKLSEWFSNPHVLIMIEWGEKVESVLPSFVRTLLFSHNGESHRTISYSPS